MMEEVSDDTNGESTFEFVGGKGEESLSKGESPCPPVPIGASIESASTSIALAPSEQHSQSAQSQSGLQAFLSSAVHGEQPVISFYDPTQHLDHKPTVLPPLSNPHPSASTIPIQNLYVSQGYPQSAESSVNPLQNQGIDHSNQHASYSSLSLPLDDNSGGISTQGNVETGVWGWLKGKDFLNKVAEKAKSSVDSVITTLDPGMKEIINTGGDINVVVASMSEVKISAVREAFQSIFGKATVQGISVQSSSIAPQPVGFSAGLKAAEERIGSLRQQGFVHDQQVLLAIENFLAELTPENWFDVGCLLLQDFSSGIFLQVYTQAVPVSSHYVMQAKDQTPFNYSLSWSGFAVTIGQILGPALGVHHSEWHKALTGVSRRDMLLLAAKSIATIYKSQLRR